MKKMNFKSIAALCLLAMVLVSCKSESRDTYVFSDYAQGIIYDRNSPAYQMLYSTAPSPKWDIAIIGSEMPVRRLSDEFCNADNRENVSGAHVGDYLPDFAGETFQCIIDSTDRLVSPDREVALRHVVAAMDTVAHITPYDLEGMLSKNRSKLIVLADPFLSYYGKSETDTLFLQIGCTVPVISPIETMLSKILPGKKGLNVGIICNSRFCGSGVYENIFYRMARDKGAVLAECFVDCASEAQHPLRSFLDKYIASPQARPLDVILVEDPEVDFEKVKSDMADLISVMNEESLIYNVSLSKDCILLESSAVLLEECYNIIRKGNLFTHNIVKPMSVVYYSSSVYTLVPETYVQN